MLAQPDVTNKPELPLSGLVTGPAAPAPRLHHAVPCRMLGAYVWLSRSIPSLPLPSLSPLCRQWVDRGTPMVWQPWTILACVEWTTGAKLDHFLQTAVTSLTTATSFLQMLACPFQCPLLWWVSVCEH